MERRVQNKARLPILIMDQQMSPKNLPEETQLHQRKAADSYLPDSLRLSHRRAVA
jgi:hypothetical protein